MGKFHDVCESNIVVGFAFSNTNGNRCEVYHREGGVVKVQTSAGTFYDTHPDGIISGFRRGSYTVCQDPSNLYAMASCDDDDIVEFHNDANKISLKHKLRQLI